MGSFHELIAGFHNFQESYLLKEKEFFDQLAHGQKPKSLVIACCDSRVDPAILLGGKPGDLFVVRSIAALIPPVGLSSPRDAVMSALEYGVKHLDVDHLIVMGHSACGGIHAALFPEKIEKEFFLSRWVQMAHPVSEELRRELTAEPTSEVLPDPSAPDLFVASKKGLCCSRSKTSFHTTGSKPKFKRERCPFMRFTTTSSPAPFTSGMRRKRTLSPHRNITAPKKPVSVIFEPSRNRQRPLRSLSY